MPQLISAAPSNVGRERLSAAVREAGVMAADMARKLCKPAS
jgi:hypothetical protein